MKNWIASLPFGVGDQWVGSTDHTSLITELMNFITDAGLTPAIGNNNQLKESVQAYISGAGTVYPAKYIEPGTLIPSNGVDTDHDITISAGKCRDSSNTVNMDLLSDITKQIDADWVEGNNAGGFSGDKTSNGNINQFNYNGKSFSVSGQDTAPTDVFFKDDGSKMYILGNTGKTVDAYDLGTNWDVNTAVYNSETIATTGVVLPYGFWMGNSGTKMYILDGNSDIIHQWTLGTAWDVSTATADGITFTVTTQESQPWGIEFTPDGTKMYVIGLIADTVFAYDLGTAWNVSTAVYNSEFFDVGNEMTAPKMIRFNSDGTIMYVAGDTTDTIFQYNLTLAYDVSTAEAIGRKLNISSQETVIHGLFVGNSDEGVYIVGTTADTVFQYDFGYLKNATFYGFIITKADGTADAGFDNSLTATNLLTDATDYLYYRRRGSYLTDENGNFQLFDAYYAGGARIKFEHKDNLWFWFETNAPMKITWTPIELKVPSGIQLDVRVEGSAYYSGSANIFAIEGKNKNDYIPIATGSLLVGDAYGTVGLSSVKKNIETIDGQAKYRANTTAVLHMSLKTVYYIDNGID